MNKTNFQQEKQLHGWRSKLHEVIFEADTFAGKVFDIALLLAILLSVLAVMLESVRFIDLQYGSTLRVVEWFFTILFTVEYIARMIAVKKPVKYIFSFMGIIDLLSIVPTYLSLIITGTHTLLVIRTIRLLRIFRILKLTRYVGESIELAKALKASRAKIIVFLVAVLSAVVILGTLMYLIESPEAGFTSIPKSIYWAIVTLTTVGYGDIAPQTVPGQTLASVIMILGYAIIAVPTGIVTAELTGASQKRKTISTQACPACSAEGHDPDARFCKFCGEKL